jgi:hypothetical protein
MKKILLLYSLLLISFCATAQHKYDIGLEGGFLFQRYKLNDPAGQLQKRRNQPTPNGIGAIALQVNTPHHLVYKVVAGFYVINYNYELKTQDYFYPKGITEQFFLMGNVGYSLPLGKKLAIIPLAGAALNFQTIYDGNQYYDFPYTTGVEVKSETPSVVFPTINGSLELQYAISKRTKLLLGGNYMAGITNRATHTISYKENGGPIHYASMTSKGSFLYFNAGIRYGFR